MGFFGKLFEKKECSLCGGEIGLLGNRKLEDGNCCKTCAGKLSYWFDERRHSTVDQIKEQLACREENRKALDAFRPAKSFGEEYALKAELENGVPVRFVVARTDDYREENADLIPFSQVTDFSIEIEDEEEELMRENEKGEEVSYNPPRYEYRYDFYARIHTNIPYCDDIRFRLNSETVTIQIVRMSFARDLDPTTYPAYQQKKAVCEELEELFRAGIQGLPLPDYAPVAQPAPQPPVSEPAPAGPKFCPNCGAPADGGKFCQSCGSRL